MRVVCGELRVVCGECISALPAKKLLFDNTLERLRVVAGSASSTHACKSLQSHTGEKAYIGVIGLDYPQLPANGVKLLGGNWLGCGWSDFALPATPRNLRVVGQGPAGSTLQAAAGQLQLATRHHGPSGQGAPTRHRTFTNCQSNSHRSLASRGTRPPLIPPTQEVGHAQFLTAGPGRDADRRTEDRGGRGLRELRVRRARFARELRSVTEEGADNANRARRSHSFTTTTEES